jgi:hypothetical protein
LFGNVGCHDDVTPSAFQLDAKKLGIPLSFTVGTLGKTSVRLSPVTARARSALALICGSAGLVVDHHRLAKRLAEFLGHRARRQVSHAACAKWHDDTDGLARERLGTGRMGHGQCGHQRDEMPFDAHEYFLIKENLYELSR